MKNEKLKMSRFTDSFLFKSGRSKSQNERVGFPKMRSVLARGGLILSLTLGVVGVGTQVTMQSPASAATYAYSARWISGPDGVTLSIVPSGYAQTVGIAAARGVMNNALSLAGIPPYSPYVYNSLMEQLECHLVFRLKTPFNLDTWRPSVSWPQELWDLCNP
jgi:hypothetical protein